MLDKYERAILRVLIAYKDVSLPTLQIAKEAEVAPLTAKRRLMRLEKQGYVKRENLTAPSKFNFPSGGSNGIMGLMIQEPGRITKILWKLRYKK